MTVARPHHVCVPLSERRQHRPARSTCADVLGVRSSPLGADMVSKSRNMSADMLFTPGLLALMPPTICCVRSQSVRDLVTEISGGATPHRCGVAQSSSSELATQAWPSQPHSRLVVPVHVGSRLAYSGSPTHPSLGRLSTVPCILAEIDAETLHLGEEAVHLRRRGVVVGVVVGAEEAALAEEAPLVAALALPPPSRSRGRTCELRIGP